MGAAASAQTELEQMVAYTFLLGHALSRAFPDIYTVNDFDANKEKIEKKMKREQEKELRMRKMNGQSAFPMVFLSPDGTVTPIQFVDQNGNPLESGHAKQINNQQDSNTSEEDDVDENEDDDDGSDVPLSECIVVQYQERQVPIRKSTVKEVNQDGWNVLHAVAHQQASAEAAQAIIQVFKVNGYDLNVKTKRGPGSYASGWTALHIACAYGITSTVRELIGAGAEVNVKNSIGWTPLFDAVHRGYTEIVQLLLKAGADSDEIIPPCMIAPYHPQYPLAHAARQGHLKIVTELLDAGANKDAQNEGGWSAMHESVFFRQEDIVKKLILYGADLSLKTAQGYTVLDFESTGAIREALEEVAPRELLEKKKSTNQAGFESKTNQGGEEEEGKSKEKPVYRLLGELPDFKANSFMQTMQNAGNVAQDSDDEDEEERRKRIEKRKSFRKKKPQTLLKSVAPPDLGVPEEYACQLTGKLLVDPVTTIYGNHFERNALVAWLRSQGNLCPVTGQPLSESDCLVDKDLRIEINDWQLKQALSKNQHGDGDDQVQVATAESEDLYEF